MQGGGFKVQLVGCGCGCVCMGEGREREQQHALLGTVFSSEHPPIQQHGLFRRFTIHEIYAHAVFWRFRACKMACFLFFVSGLAGNLAFGFGLSFVHCALHGRYALFPNFALVTAACISYTTSVVAVAPGPAAGSWAFVRCSDSR
jgi:hypothetical protein